MNKTNCPVCHKEIVGNWTGNPKVYHHDCIMESTKDVREFVQGIPARREAERKALQDKLLRR